jgi:RNA polymerase sigma factor (sigma-70 family)
MPGGQLAPSGGELGLLADTALLQRFVAQRDEAAFALLVRRHGPMVRATCRRCLGNTPELDDAFQVVFLVLARKATSVRRRELLGPWLHAVAVRAAIKLRTRLHRQREREQPVMPLPEPAPVAPAEPRDWVPLLDEELRRLPPRFGAPLVLCELQGHSRAEAATLLGVPEGTLSSRLARGRELLRQRLGRRGLTATALGLATALSATAAVPAALLSTTTHAATSGAANPAVAAITREVLRAMLLSKIKSAATVVTVAAIVVTGLLAGAALATGGGKTGKSDKELLQGRWQVVSAKVGGKEADADELAQMKSKPLEFKGDKVLSRHEAEYKIDPAKDPRTIDVTPLEGPPAEKGKTFRGFYKLEGDKLTLVMALLPDGDRPSSLTPPEGELAGVMVMVLERVKEGK